MAYLHILRDRGWFKTPPWAAHERLAGLRADEMVLTDCCFCRMRADETVAVIRRPPDDPNHGRSYSHVKWVKGQPRWDRGREHRHWWMSYYDAEQRLFCGPGFGCAANPRRKRGSQLRSYWKYGA